MRPLQNRHAERTSARYCSKSPDYPHRNSVAPLFSSTGFSSPKQARAPDSSVPCSARLGQPGRAGGVAGSGAGAEGGACLRLGAGSGSARRRKFPGRWGRRTHPESLVSASRRRRQRRAAPQWRWVTAGRGCAAPLSRREEGEKRAPCARCAEGSPAGEQEGARLARGRLLRCFLERRRWECRVGRGAPGEGRRGSGSKARGRALEVPGARVGRDECGGGRDVELWGTPAATRGPAGCRESPGVAGHLLWRLGTPTSCRGVGSETKRERRVAVFLFAFALRSVYFLPGT